VSVADHVEPSEMEQRGHQLADLAESITVTPLEYDCHRGHHGS